MIIDAGHIRGLGRVATVAGMTMAVFALWVGLLGAFALTRPAGSTLTVIGDPNTAILSVARAGGLVVSVGPLAVTAVSPQPKFAARLYASGARLVIPAIRPGGCMGEPPTGRPALTARS